MHEQSTLQQRFRGCLLGLMAADAFGAPFEGVPASIITSRWGSVRDLVDEPPVEELFYTDDTEMTIGVAEALLEDGEIRQETLCRRFIENYRPERGYGPGARRILETMGRGGDWQDLTHNMFPGGSYGNGGAMRVAPVGLLFHSDLTRLKHEAEQSCLPTHIHPLAIDAACLIGVAVAIVMRPGVLARYDFLRELSEHAATEEFQYQLGIAGKLKVDDSVLTLGNSLEAHRSVGTAIAAFSQSPEDYEAVVAKCVGLGNDTDTLAAMAGCLVGAHLGEAAIPASLTDRLEEQGKGKQYVLELADRLYERWRQMHEAG